MMYGNPEYCMKHGHDWVVYTNIRRLGEIVYQCKVCGAKQIRFDK